MMVSPYGQGICSYPEEQADFKTRIFENIPVNDETAFSRATLLNCYVDEANNCRRIFTLGPQPARNQARRGFANSLIWWLPCSKGRRCSGVCLTKNFERVYLSNVQLLLI